MEVRKMPDKLLDLKNDLVFQRLFGTPKNSKIISHLLSLILKREIYNIDLDANKVMLGNSKNSKTVSLDVRVKFNDGEDCNIELQVRPFKCMESRMLEYWANMYSRKIYRGENMKY
jgi:predicted transposase/invertase (TIGR01784 family)